MPENTTQNYYFPFLRRGLGAGIKPRTAPTDANGEKKEQRPSVDVAMSVLANPLDGSETPHEISQKIALYGPGDVLGFEAGKLIWRTQPTADDGNFIPNNVPFIEFREADFPWRYSSTQENGNWIPWLTLVTLKMEDTGEEGEFAEDKQRLPGLPNRVIVKPGTVLPTLSAAWRWAHVSCQSTPDKSAQWLKQKIYSSHDFAVSRLICPRRLKPGVKYATFVVPTYLLGVQAALGENTSETDRSQLAWNGSGQANDLVFRTGLPYYHRWEFRTGLRGDFEQMIRLIQPRPLKKLGGKVINISNPGFGLGTPAEEPLQTITIDGALQSTDANDQETLPEEQQRIDETANRLLVELNKSEGDQGDDIPRVVPPIYGRWVNNRESSDNVLSLDGEGWKERWLETTNLDVRYRIPAGLGVQYVKEHQEELMSAAWDQLARVQRENRFRNLGRFGREISKCLYKRLDQVKNAETFVGLTEPLHGKIAFSASESQAFVVMTPGGMGTGTIPGGNSMIPPVNLKLPLSTQLKHSAIANSRLHLKWRKYNASSLPIRPPVTENENFDRYRLDRVVATTVGKSRLVTSNRSWSNKPVGDAEREGLDALQLRNFISNKLQPKNTIEQRILNSLSTTTVDAVDSDQADALGPAMAYPEFHEPMYKHLLALSEDYFLPNLDQVPQNTISALITNRKFIEAFLLGLNHEFAAELRWRGYPTDLRGSYFRKFWDSTIYSMDDTEKKQFRESAYGKALQSDLEMSWSAIEEAFFDLTNEQAADRYEEAVEKWMLTREEDKEINSLESWLPNTALGTHSMRNSPSTTDPSDNEVVLMIRADVLRKYPNTFIYLAEAEEVEEKKRLKPGGVPVYPIFEASLPPDIVCIGFPLSESEARQHFIVFEERLSEQRFGLDAAKAEQNASALNNLSWDHFPDEIEEEGYLNNHEPTATEAATKWNSASYIARAFTQQPVRMAVDLDSLMP